MRQVLAAALVICCTILASGCGSDEASTGDAAASADGSSPHDTGGGHVVECDNWHAGQAAAIAALAASLDGCATDGDCVVVAASTPCLGACPSAVAAANEAAFNEGKGAIAGKWCVQPYLNECEYPAVKCATPRAYCGGGHCMVDDLLVQPDGGVDAGETDVGSTDGGAMQDAGNDSGLDASSHDASDDASVPDAGADASVPDAGADAGTGVDAGSHLGTVDDPIPLYLTADTPLPLPFSYDDRRDTRNAVSDAINAYPPSTVNESGPEFIYVFTVDAPARVSVRIDSPEPAGTDVDVHLLSSVRPPVLVDRDNLAVSAALKPGKYFLSLDTYVNASGAAFPGPYHLLVNATPDDGSNPLEAAGVPPDVAALALTAYTNGRAQNLTSSSVFSVIDFSQSSVNRRLWTVDMATGATLFNDHVAHGSGSNSANDPAMADTFSNTSGSNMSSLGLCLTAETYDGSNGYSLRLDGLEDSNSNMRSRAIVVHGAWYAEDDFVTQNGYTGRSNGCPAVAASKSTAFIDIIKDGTLMFAYYPDQSWLNSSPFLK